MSKWGVIGIGRMANLFINSLEHSGNGKLYAIASKSKKNVALYERKYPGLKVYDNYEDLLDDRNVDAVYIALPHTLHVPVSLMALQRNVPVLCEKPAGLSTKEFQQVIDLNQKTGNLYIEAMKSRFMDAHQQLMKDLLLIGDVENIFCKFTYALNQVGSYVFDDKQGGILYDYVCYPIAFILDVVNSDIHNIDASTIKEEDTDLEYYIEMLFKSGATATIEGSVGEEDSTLAIIHGVNGKITVPTFTKPTSYVVELKNHQIYERKFDDFGQELVHEINAMDMCISKGLRMHPDMTLEDSYDILEVIEMIKKEIQ